MNMTVVRPGMLTTIQDCGRWGSLARGVPVSGAMDVYSHRFANALVGNDSDAATLEVTLMGPEVAFNAAATIAVAGAEFRATHNGSAIEMRTAVHVSAGSVVRFGERLCGARAYLAVAGGIDVPVVLGSRATHVLTATGGFGGRALRAGDILNIGNGGRSVPPAALRLTAPVVMPQGGARLRVIVSPDGAGALLSDRYVVSPRSDRMGYRLDGAAVFVNAPGEMISAPVPTGAIQVPPSGQPILLMNDHATAGGYAVAATVITADLPVAGQLAPGDWIEFERCSLNDADAALRDREDAFAAA
jgi:antagonist of KipI